VFWNPFTIAIGGFLVALGLYGAVSSLWRARGNRKFVGFFGGILMAYGISAFYGLAFFSAWQFAGFVRVADGSSRSVD